MSYRRIWTCDRCRAEKSENEMGGSPEGWACGQVFLPKMGGSRSVDLCGPCQDELKRVWNEWLNPPSIAEQKQAEIDRRKERIAEIAKDRGQHEPRGRFPSEHEPGEDYWANESNAVDRLQWWARSKAP